MPDLMEKPERVPIQPRWETHRRVWKAVQFFKREPAVIERSQDGAAALGSKVDGEEFKAQSTTLAETTRISASPLAATLALPIATFWPVVISALIGFMPSV